MSEQIYVAAGEVEPGNYLPGLDNAYVYDFQPYNIFNDDGDDSQYTVIYHDNVGNEGYLLLTPDTRIEVLRQ